MIIIVEGIDKVGKTTLCRMIERRYRDKIDIRRFRDNTRYAHGHTNMIVNTEKNNTIVSLIEAGIIKNIILDRFHITEFVYGVIDRSYKNNDMWDIDKRLADIDKPDTSIEDSDSDDIDQGMSFDGHIQNDVILIYVVPVDIDSSSEKHGYNLERHLKWFNDFYKNTSIKNKIKVDYKTLNLALEFIDGFIKIDDSGESTKPIGGVEMELKTHTIVFDENSKTYNLPVVNTKFNVYVNGLYMTENVDYIIDRTVIPNIIIFKDIYKQENICTLTYFVKKEV